MKTIRITLAAFIALLVLSGLSAFPVRTEINFLIRYIHSFPDFMHGWIVQLFTTIYKTDDVMLYGTDWLAFAHIVIASFFIPVYIDPVKYKINMIMGMTACLLIFPLAFICGPVRGIPFFHQLIDCSFGLFGFLLLLFIYRKINVLEKNNTNIHSQKNNTHHA